MVSCAYRLTHSSQALLTLSRLDERARPDDGSTDPEGGLSTPLISRRRRGCSHDLLKDSDRWSGGQLKQVLQGVPTLV